MDEIAQEDELIAQFAGVASVPASEARQYLAANNWDLPAALAEFYTAQEEAGAEDEQHNNRQSYEEEDEGEEDTPAASHMPSGGRRLGDGPSDPQPIPTSASSRPSESTKQPVPQKKFATLGDFNSDSHTHGDDDGDEDDGKQDLFAGGEKSGLAVQNPDDIKKKILEKAMRSSKPPAPKEAPKPQSSHFTGSARTLGGDDTPSRVIESPSVPQTSRHGERVDRVLHFWNDGFSVDDGDLYRSDDPRNADILNGIRQGRAPLSIMNVLPGQEVDVEIKQHQENYVRPKKKYVPFGGQGNRLGSPTPGVPSMPGSFTTTPAPSAPSTTTETPSVNVDESQPIVNLQIRLGSGTRLPARFNATHTIGDVYAFVVAASPDSQNSEWVLQTTFPSAELTDMGKTLGDMPEFKRGGVVVQKWK